MQKRLVWRDYLCAGSMLFDLFFGTGDLIFPVHMGQEAGASTFLANLDSLAIGVGLPPLGIIAMGVSKSSGVFDLASRINRRYALIFTLLLYLTIGPFFALPRLVITSFEISLAPFVSKGLQWLVLAGFLALFFLAVRLLSRKPSKILDYAGKPLNPLFLALLGILIVLAFVKPLGHVTSTTVGENYISSPFFKGFTEGYNTLDALASLAFGIAVISTLRNMGAEKPGDIIKGVIESGAFSAVLMGIIYTLLAYMGTMSIGASPISENGGAALTQIANYYLGLPGSILLAFIVTLAYLKTSIGLNTAFSEVFEEMFPKVSYQKFLAIVVILSAIFASVGLTNIIQFTVPVLMSLYPLAITLMLLVIISPIFKRQREVYRATTYTTLVAAVLDALNSAPAFIRDTAFVTVLLEKASQYLPLLTIGMGWVVPATVAFLISWVWVMIFKKNPILNQLLPKRH